MKKIAILRCLESNDVCTGASCMEALNTRSRNFSDYEEQPMLVAFFSCNGCEERVLLKNQVGLEEKLERLRLIGTEIVHVGACAWIINAYGEKIMCPKIADLIERIKKMGIEIVYGTH